jgi:hypothetical protein
VVRRLRRDLHRAQLPERADDREPVLCAQLGEVRRGAYGAAIGEVLVFKREGGGHVGFYVGEDATRFRVLGGNQSNSVSETWVSKNRLYARRWPSTYPLPVLGAVKVFAAGATSTNEA